MDKLPAKAFVSLAGRGRCSTCRSEWHAHVMPKFGVPVCADVYIVEISIGNSRQPDLEVFQAGSSREIFRKTSPCRDIVARYPASKILAYRRVQ